VSVDRVPYGVQLPWPTAANGQGSALSRVATEAFGCLASSWSALAPTPGTARFAQVGDLDFDGAVDTDDIRRFAQVLADPLAYQAVFGRWAAMLADVDGDEDVDFDDIDDFMALLGGAMRGAAVRANVEPEGAQSHAPTRTRCRHLLPCERRRFTERAAVGWAIPDIP